MHTYTRKGLLTRGGEEMRGVALNERVRASVKEPGRVETGKSRLYLPEDGEGGRARRRRDGGVGAGGESRLPTGVAGYKSASASAPAIISIPPSLHPPLPPSSSYAAPQ